MRHVTLLLFTVLFDHLPVTAQQKITTYYDSRNKEVAADLPCSYYQVLSDVVNEGDTAKTYFCATKSIRSVAIINVKGEYNGPVVLYHPNGKQRARIIFKNGIPAGSAKSWYPEGTMQSMEVYAPEKPFEPVILHYWDSTGIQRVVGGSGYCKCVFSPWSEPEYYFEGKLVSGKPDSLWTRYSLTGIKQYEESFRDGAVVTGSRHYFDENLVLEVVEESARPEKGMSGFYEEIGRIIKYPLQARRLNVQGKVIVEFVVEKDGTLTEIKTIKGIGSGCDEEAERVLRNVKKWIPGSLHGKPVRQKMVLPILFKLP
jgi:TonB family protein